MANFGIGTLATSASMTNFFLIRSPIVTACAIGQADPDQRQPKVSEEIMKATVGLLAAAAVIAAMSAARADDSDKFLIRGDATKVMMEQNQLNVATAEAIAKACVEEAAKQGVRISIAILDQFGEPVYFYRMDGQNK